jgi:hypothetical protein
MEGNVSVMGLDPGVTTGLSILTVTAKSLIDDEPGQIVSKNHIEIRGSLSTQVMAIADWASGLSSSAGFSPVIVYEEFDLDPRKYHSRNPELLAPVRLIGAIQYANECNHFGSIILTSQSRSLAKEDATNERLKEWGLYTAGSDHIRDATRQAITFIRRVKNNATLRFATWKNYGIVR